MKLRGIRVVDLSVFLPGPYLSMSLADHGAEVIKVEAPGEGDPGRHIGLSDGPDTVFFRNVNRGKKSVVVDLKNPEERERLLRLVDTADVFIEAFRPGVAERLGVDYATLSARNPGLVYASLSAFGQSGPYRNRPAHDMATEALAGVIGITLGEDDKPAIPGLPVADILTALQGLSGILMALLRRTQTGRGDYIDLSMHESVLAATTNVLGPTFAEGRQPIPKHERTTGGSAFYRIYETADGRHLTLAGQEPKFIRNLLSALGRLDLAPLCEQGPGPHQAPVVAFLAETFRTRPLAEWVSWFEPLDVCFAPVNTLPEALADPQVEARGAVLRDEAGRPHLAPVIRFLHEPAEPRLAVPAMGQHNGDML
ncbi:CaiB/BaiF CoA transferase family protein [Enterovirga rhinocerotis]|uniref:Crotonobetainyl-CoA:carnitine CoA-transferase CaiB-like acyl-CoA transferase n=1 Tax=Enterovirga rhinocerotis TaxID=1339210 RepID=A0A4R7BW31_9HYPH|nr:CoA transferase [Enterovirga rhinocerotis]TDR90070.1 crotonobetainyl-CoA:carnitine CoA-transferase CaiB-like acyl-CoA transferase [Enterovirga rhinocerotis]